MFKSLNKIKRNIKRAFFCEHDSYELSHTKRYRNKKNKHILLVLEFESCEDCGHKRVNIFKYDENPNNPQYLGCIVHKGNWDTSKIGILINYNEEDIINYEEKVNSSNKKPFYEGT